MENIKNWKKNYEYLQKKHQEEGCEEKKDSTGMYMYEWDEYLVNKMGICEKKSYKINE
jgi:hypothetical protein